MCYGFWLVCRAHAKKEGQWTKISLSTPWKNMHKNVPSLDSSPASTLQPISCSAYEAANGFCLAGRAMLRTQLNCTLKTNPGDLYPGLAHWKGITFSKPNRSTLSFQTYRLPWSLGIFSACLLMYWYIAHGQGVALRMLPVESSSFLIISWVITALWF